MAFRISPNVQIREEDATTTIRPVTLGATGYVGDFAFGPVGKVTRVDTEDGLITKFGRPTADVYSGYLDAQNYFQYASGLRVVRVTGDAAANACDSSQETAPTINNEDVWDASTQDQAKFIARYPGSLGNSIRVSVTDAAGFDAWAYKNLFSNAPDANEIHVAVIDLDGKISGNAGTVLETYGYASTNVGSKDLDGSVNYYKTWINRASNFVYVGNDFVDAGNFDLEGGADSPPDDADYQLGLDMFANPKTVDINSLFVANVSSTVAAYAVSSVAEVRKDCVVYIAPTLDDVVGTTQAASNVETFKTAMPASSYYMMADQFKYVLDKYNETYRWISTASDLAGLSAATDEQNDPWFAPAGYNRGILKNVVKLAWEQSQSDEDALFALAVNSIRMEQGIGAVLMGDKTGLTKPSSFGQIGIRKLFNVLEKQIANAAKYSLFELNDAITQARFVNMVVPFLEDVKGRRGMEDFQVIADDRINTPQVKANNEFRAKIRIKPLYSIRYVVLSFVSEGPNVEFNETVED